MLASGVVRPANTLNSATHCPAAVLVGEFLDGASDVFDHRKHNIGNHEAVDGYLNGSACRDRSARLESGISVSHCSIIAKCQEKPSRALHYGLWSMLSSCIGV